MARSMWWSGVCGFSVGIFVAALMAMQAFGEWDVVTIGFGAYSAIMAGIFAVEARRGGGK